MAFEGLSSRLQSITRKFGGKARVTEQDLKEMLREVKLALLEADVNYKIVTDFISITIRNILYMYKAICINRFLYSNLKTGFSIRANATKRTKNAAISGMVKKL